MNKETIIMWDMPNDWQPNERGFYMVLIDHEQYFFPKSKKCRIQKKCAKLWTKSIVRYHNGNEWKDFSNINIK